MGQGTLETSSVSRSVLDASALRPLQGRLGAARRTLGPRGPRQRALASRLASGNQDGKTWRAMGGLPDCWGLRVQRLPKSVGEVGNWWPAEPAELIPGAFLLSFQGLVFVPHLPRACAPSTSSGQALGCILAPLRGWGWASTTAAKAGSLGHAQCSAEAL